MGRPKKTDPPVVSVGDIFGALTVVERLPSVESHGRTFIMWRCSCTCGNTLEMVRQNSLTNGNTSSCGCYQKLRAREAKTKHTIPRRVQYVWQEMKQRCYNKHHKNFHNYGGRGITVCERWIKDIRNFVEDMGYPPSGLTLDRIDNNKGYYKDNCRWASRTQQNNNRRPRHV